MNKRTILLVDDEEDIREVLGLSLKDWGYQVFTARDAEEALQIFRQEKPSIILTDIKMPGMDGIELLKTIKTEDPESEVIMITGHGDMDLAIQSLKFEATDFVTKPIHDEVLEIALKRCQERISLRRQIKDYTENLEKMVDEKTRRLIEAERLSAVGEAVADLSHTIKNLSGALKGGMFVLKQGIDLDNRDYLQQGWEMVDGNVEKIQKLSLDLLNYGKSTEIELLLTDPALPAKAVAEMMAPQAKEQEVELISNIGPDLIPVKIDAEAVQRALLNLVSNALDACLMLEGEDAQRRVVIEVDAARKSGVEYRVQDTGIGMDKSVQKRIFQSFFTTKGSKGSGIGLLATRKIVELHGGEIRVESKKGKGTTVTIRLPG